MAPAAASAASSTAPAVDPPIPEAEEAQQAPVPVMHLALAAVATAPLFVTVPAELNIVLTASLAVMTGCFRSVKSSGEGMQETMTEKDAMKFPFIGSAVLFSLFLLFKYLPKDIINALLTAYFVFLGVVALTATMLPFASSVMSPTAKDRVIRFGSIKRFPWLVKFIEMEELEITLPQLFCAAASTGFCIWYFCKKHWLANNTLGLAFSVQGIEFLSVGSVKIGAILLCGLFFYDIFWVFCTPVMVSVAKNFEAPIKLLFPRLQEVEGAILPAFSALGLGDIVVPGIFVALCLRYDVSKGSGRPYFTAAFIGYVVGLATTIFVMTVFNAAQPALLYIVPGVLGAVGICCLLKGDAKELLAYEEGGVLSDLVASDTKGTSTEGTSSKAD